MVIIGRVTLVLVRTLHYLLLPLIPLRYCPAKKMKMMEDESILLDLLACSYDEKSGWYHSLRHTNTSIACVDFYQNYRRLA